MSGVTRSTPARRRPTARDRLGGLLDHRRRVRRGSCGCPRSPFSLLVDLTCDALARAGHGGGVQARGREREDAVEVDRHQRARPLRLRRRSVLGQDQLEDRRAAVAGHVRGAAPHDVDQARRRGTAAGTCRPGPGARSAGCVSKRPALSTRARQVERASRTQPVTPAPPRSPLAGLTTQAPPDRRDELERRREVACGRTRGARAPSMPRSTSSRWTRVLSSASRSETASSTAVSWRQTRVETPPRRISRKPELELGDLGAELARRRPSQASR